MFVNVKINSASYGAENNEWIVNLSFSMGQSPNVWTVETRLSSVIDIIHVFDADGKLFELAHVWIDNNGTERYAQVMLRCYGVDLLPKIYRWREFLEDFQRERALLDA